MPWLKIAQVATADISIRFLLLDQITALQADGHDVVAVCAPGPWVEKVRQLGVNVETVEMRRELSLWRDIASLRALARCFRKHKFDVVHTHTPKAGLLGPIAARMAGIPVVVHTVHGLLFHDRMPLPRQAIFWAPERLTAGFSDYLLSQSREDMARAVRTRLCTSRKIIYLGNGIDVARFTPSHVYDREEAVKSIGLFPSDFIVGSVGRLVKEKGFVELFAAAEELTARYPDLKFVVIGPQEPDQKDAISPAYIDNLHRRGIVRFLNFRDDTALWYASMDAFVMPSYREGIPRACMEAAAMMKPVIASDIRGCREVVLHGQTGLLVPPRNVPALVDAIETLYKDRAESRRMGEFARRHIMGNFNNKIVCERLCDFYSRLAPSPKAAGTREEPAYD